jgi:hypothetical protein
MSADSDKFAGKVKEAAGDITGDQDLKAEREKQQEPDVGPTSTSAIGHHWLWRTRSSAEMRVRL